MKTGKGGMPLPKWVAVEAVDRTAEGRMRLWLRPRKWHPGYWLFWLQRSAWRLGYLFKVRFLSCLFGSKRAK